MRNGTLPPDNDSLFFIRPADLAERLGVTEATVRQWVSRGILPPLLKFSPRWTGWRLGPLKAWLDAVATRPRPKPSQPQQGQQQPQLEADTNA